MRVGFIGVGMMGKGMAANLQKAGHDLVVYDLSRSAAEPFLAKGAVWANSPKEVGAQSEIVFTSLPVPADVEQVAQAHSPPQSASIPGTLLFTAPRISVVPTGTSTVYSAPLNSTYVTPGMLPPWRLCYTTS